MTIREKIPEWVIQALIASFFSVLVAYLTAQFTAKSTAETAARDTAESTAKIVIQQEVKRPDSDFSINVLVPEVNARLEQINQKYWTDHLKRFVEWKKQKPFNPGLSSGLDSTPAQDPYDIFRYPDWFLDELGYPPPGTSGLGDDYRSNTFPTTPTPP